MKKRVIGLMIAIMFPFYLGSCSSSKEGDNLKWINSNAVYASVNEGYEQEILSNVEDAFRTLSFEKIYVTEKYVNSYTPLVLLFILDEKIPEDVDNIIKALSEDERINHARVSRDLYYEAIDTRYIKKLKDTILVGETLLLELKGNIDFYVKPFSYEGLLIKPKDNKSYTIEDFPQLNLGAIETRDNGWLYLELIDSDYFEVIKTADVLSRLSTIEKVELDKQANIMIPPDIWEISDTSIAIFESIEGGGYPAATIKGVSIGVVTISFGNMSCKITVY